jgi:cytochrome c553
VYRFALVLPALFPFALLVAAQQPQQNPAPKPQNSPDYSGILVQAAKEPNPVKATPESLTRAKKWWAMDCAMCHGDSGNGKGDRAVDLKLNVVDQQKGSSKAETPVATRDGEQKGAPVMNTCEIERSSREASKEWSRRPRAWVLIRRIQQVL